MKILMYGWEFPPHISGGLGMACYGIVSELAKRDNQITLVLPKTIDNIITQHNLSVIGCNSIPSLGETIMSLPSSVNITQIKTLFHPYITEESYRDILRNLSDVFSCEYIPKKDLSILTGQYGPDLLSEVFRYAVVAGSAALYGSYDIIHAHDWLTILAGIEARKHIHKPLVFQVHALETDRSGEHVNSNIYAIEKYGLEQADCIIAVSEYTKSKIIQNYGIAPEKISVVHNGIYLTDIERKRIAKPLRNKMVLFVGRVTHQKGPWYFIETARKILSKRHDVHFVVAGSGDLIKDMIEHVAAERLGSRVHFTGFLNQQLIKKLYQLADVYVMPSVSEPFGLAALEALAHNIPVVVSKQSGVAEVLGHVLKTDFWDIDDMVTKILALIDYRSLREEMINRSSTDLSHLAWDKNSEKMMKVYQELITRRV